MHLNFYYALKLKAKSDAAEKINILLNQRYPSRSFNGGCVVKWVEISFYG